METERENKVKKEVYMADQETVRLEKLETTTEQISQILRGIFCVIS